MTTNLSISILDKDGVAVTEIKPFSFSSPVAVTTPAVMLVGVVGVWPSVTVSNVSGCRVPTGRGQRPSWRCRPDSNSSSHVPLGLARSITPFDYCHGVCKRLQPFPLGGVVVRLYWV